MLHFHKFYPGVLSVFPDFLVLNLDIPCDVRTFKLWQDFLAERMKINLISWLTVSNQIVKSLSLSYKKFYFFNVVQPIDLIFCKMVEIIEQNIFNRADFLFRS